MGSPAQRFMSRRTRTHLPTSVDLLQPKVVDPELVRNRLLEARMNQKYYYDRTARKLPEITAGDAVRIRTQAGWQPATFINKHQMPNSHMVRAGDRAREFRRNRRDLLKTKEQPHDVRPLRRPVRGRIQPPDSERTCRAEKIGSATRSETERSETRPAQMPQGVRASTRLASGISIKQPKWLEDFAT